ncbi:MAG: SDR family NAD(P)-dependent oxidoreductase, partial [Pseudomonadota bacterium]
MDFANKTVAITGGATGIGLALAKRLCTAGAKVVLGEPREAKLNSALEILQAAGHTAYAHPLDVRDASSMEAFANFAWAQAGRIDALVNNAGISLPMASMLDTPMDAVKNLFDVNLFGVWHGAATFGRRFVDQGGSAAIFNVGSENAFFCAVPKLAAYIASKHAVRGLTEAMRDEFPEAIQIGLICPGFVRSDLTAGPMADLAMSAEAFADIIVPQMEAGAFYIVS